MQQQTSIYIPKPCHEDWNKMTPTQQGKFCSACSKQVIDFSLMSDNQILNVLSNQSGKLCGRFDAEQLQRPLVETKIKKKKSWWMALTMPLLFLFDKSEAQKNVSKQNHQDKPVREQIMTVGKLQPRIVADTDTIENISFDTSRISRILETKMPICEPPPLVIEKELTGTVGMVIIDQTQNHFVKGKVIDNYNYPVPFATIKQKEINNTVSTDAEGFFTINISSSKQEATLIASAVGTETTEYTINFSEDSATIVMMLMNRVLAGDVVVTVAGGISACRRVKTIDTLNSTAKKIFGTAMFKMYPNPVINNGIINLQIKNTGNYQMQLLDNQSRLIQTEEINVDAKNATTQIQLQSNIAAGMYYLRLINEQTKKQYTEKLIIQ